MPSNFEVPKIMLTTIPLDPTETSRIHEIISATKRILGRTVLAMSLATSITIAENAIIEPHPVMAENGGYPDADAPCVANKDGKTTGVGYWCDEYQWGYYKRNSQGEIIGDNQNSSRGYGYRNCTDWVAFRIPQLVDKDVPIGLGDSQDWNDNAPANTVDNTPEPGDIAVWEAPAGRKYGHVAVVESVNADGTVNVSEYNKGQNGIYGTSNNVTAHHYIDLNGTGKGLHGADIGTPAPPADTDHDSVPDPQDHCPGVPGIPALHGCPPKDIDRDGIADLVIVDTANTQTGKTEAHELTGGSGYTAWFGHQSTAAEYTLPGQHVLMGDVDADHRPDLVIINTTNTGSGKVEVHAMDGSKGFQEWNAHDPTALTLGQVKPSQRFGLADLNGDNRADLVIVDTQNTATGKVEVHALDAATHYSTWINHWQTPADYLGPDQQVLFGDANGDGRPDVLIINTANTQTGKVEVHPLDGSRGFSNWLGHWRTPLDYLVSGQRLAVGDVNADGIADVIVINGNGAQNGSGKVEVHPINGAMQYSTWLGHHTVSPLASLNNSQQVVIGG